MLGYAVYPSAPPNKTIADRLLKYGWRNKYIYIYIHALKCYEKRNSLSTGDPANSGFSRMQLNIVSRYDC
jgi:hypothetical protein